MVKNIRKSTIKAARPRELAAPPSAPGRLLKISPPVVRPPDIPGLARLGGLPANIVPYRVRAFRESLYVGASGNSTCTVNESVAVGFSTRIEDARQVFLQYRQNLGASEIKNLVEDIDWIEDQWVEQKLMGPEEIDADKLGAELRDHLVARIPVLQE